MLTKEQLLLRQEGIGASEIGAIIGVNPYQNALDVYLDKVSPIPEEDPLADNEAVYWGCALEGPIANRYAELNNVELVESSTVKSKKYPFLLCTPDRLVKGTKKGLEVKTAGAYAAKNWKNNQIPESYLMQCHQSLLVMDYESWDLVVLIQGQEFLSFTIERDPEMDAIIIAEGKKFWDGHVLTKMPPEPDYESPYAIEALKKIYDTVDADMQVNLDASADHWAQVWQDSKAHISEYKSVADAAQAHILSLLKTAHTGVLPSGALVIRKEIKRKGYEVKAGSYIQLNYKGSDK